MDRDVFLRRFGGLADAQWLQLLIRSCPEPTIEGVEFPSFPAPSLQTC